MQVEANEISISCVIDGRADAPWVTFITGIANDATMWDGQISELEEDFHILRVNSRGHGGTQATEGDYTFDMLIGGARSLGRSRSPKVSLGRPGTRGLYRDRFGD